MILQISMDNMSVLLGFTYWEENAEILLICLYALLESIQIFNIIWVSFIYIRNIFKKNVFKPYLTIQDILNYYKKS